MTSLVGHADDVAVLISARSIELAQLKLDLLVMINLWMRDQCWSVALDKTKFVVLIIKLIETIIPMRVGDRGKAFCKVLGSDDRL